MNEHMAPSEVREGKIELTAECDGLFRIDVERLDEINDIDQVMIASRHTNTPVKKGDKLLGTRVIPLVIAKEKMELVRERAGGAPLDVYKRQALYSGLGCVTGHNFPAWHKFRGGKGVACTCAAPVSYTHLDVYKRQPQREKCGSQHPEDNFRQSGRIFRHGVFHHDV